MGTSSLSLCGLGGLCVRFLLHGSGLVLGGGLMEVLADAIMSVIVKTAKDHAMRGTSRRSALATQAGTSRWSA